jgi:hypothetical protein
MTNDLCPIGKAIAAKQGNDDVLDYRGRCTKLYYHIVSCEHCASPQSGAGFDPLTLKNVPKYKHEADALHRASLATLPKLTAKSVDTSKLLDISKKRWRTR